MNVGLCPDRDLLGSHLLGKVRGEAAHLIDQHLATCEWCLQVAQELRAEDEFTQAMRAGKPKLAGDAAQVAAVIQRGKQLRSEPDTLQSGETAAGRGDQENESGEGGQDEDLSFLAPPEQPDEIGRLGGYRILEVLGVGGMGIVFRAEDPKLGRLTALKALRPAIAVRKSAKDRFLREAKAAAAIEHDHIITIFQVGEDRGVPFIAMQFLRGESLQRRLQREKRLTEREVLRIGREAAAGLAAAHRCGLIHRDVKPDNLWLEEESGRVKILDFGLVRAATDDAGLTQSGVVVGTPRYMAPEQAEGKEVDARSDLFSLGSVLYHLAAGKAPFEGSSLTATLIAVARANPAPIEMHCPGLHPDVSRLIMRLLSKDREQRPASAADVSRGIAEIERRLDAPRVRLDDQAAPPPGSRKPLVGGAMVAVALAIVLAFWAAGSFFNNEAEHHAQDAVSPPSVPKTPPSSSETYSLPVASFSPRDREAAQWVLSLGGEVAIDTKASSGEFVRSLAELPAEPFAVTWIDLAGIRELQDDDLRRLTGLRSLAMLHLQDTGIGDEGVAHLTDLPELVYLNLVATQVTEKGLAVLSPLPKLKNFFVSRCPVGDAAIPILREMKLSQLTLDGSEITFDGLRKLAGHPTLRKVTVAHLGLTGDEVQQLRDLLPNCQIQADRR